MSNTPKLTIYGALMVDSWADFGAAAIEAFEYVKLYKTPLTLAVQGEYLAAKGLLIPVDIESPDVIERMLWQRWHKPVDKLYTPFRYTDLPKTHREKMAEKEKPAAWKTAKPAVLQGEHFEFCPRCERQSLDRLKIGNRITDRWVCYFCGWARGEA